MNVLAKVMPLIFLILFGYILQRSKYFEEVTFSRLQNFILRVTIPCLLFSAFVNMEVDISFIWVSISFFCYLIILLLMGWLLYRLLPIKYDFFIFFLTAFGFGTVGLPIFTSIFGLANSGYMALLGVGHEFFIAGVYIPVLQFYFSNAKPSWSSFGKTLCTPIMIMVTLGVLIFISGAKPLLAGNFIGQGLLDAISKLGDLTLALALVLTGYRIRLHGQASLKSSMLYAGLRLLITVAMAVLFKLLLLDPLLPAEPLLDHALYTLILQHGPIVLIVYVGQYRPLEDQIAVNNAFVLHLIVSIALFFMYMLCFV